MLAAGQYRTHDDRSVRVAYYRYRVLNIPILVDYHELSFSPYPLTSYCLKNQLTLNDDGLCRAAEPVLCSAAIVTDVGLKYSSKYFRKLSPKIIEEFQFC